MSTDALPASKRQSLSSEDVHMRVLIEPGFCARLLGAGGKNLRRLRLVADESGHLSAHISPDIGARWRVLHVNGAPLNVGKFFGHVVRCILEENDGPASSKSKQYNMRVLVPNQIMGRVIGTKMAIIHNIEAESNAHLSADREKLGKSEDRIVHVYGVCDAVHIALYHLAEIFLQNKPQVGRSVQYDPSEDAVAASSGDPSPRAQSLEKLRSPDQGGSERSEAPTPRHTQQPLPPLPPPVASRSSPSPEVAKSPELEMTRGPLGLQTAFEVAKQSQKRALRQILKAKEAPDLPRLVADIERVSDVKVAILDEEDGTLQIDGEPEENVLAIFLVYRAVTKKR